MEAYTRSVMCGRANNTFSHAARQMLPARCLSQTLTEEFICIVCSALVRHCACICSHFSWAHIPWSIHVQYTTTGAESECSSVCPEPPDRRNTYRYLQCLLMAVLSHSLFRGHTGYNIPQLIAHTPAASPSSNTHWQCRFMCKPYNALFTHTQSTHTIMHYWTSDNWTMTLPTVQSSLDHMHTWWICNGTD